jgi:ornithine cyclodeaminase/alanine dehydrogenase-like protein (mu-crystallin family)
MLILSEAVTREVVDLDSILAIIRQEALAQANDRVVYSDPPTQVMVLDEPRCRYRLKTCALPDIPVAGIRIIGYPTGKKGEVHDSTRFVLLSDPASGTPLALIDDHWTYTLRTAASATLGLTYLTADKPLKVAMIGAGNLAGAMLDLLHHIGRLAEVKVTSRRTESRDAFARKYADKLDRKVQSVSTVKEALSDADLVVTSTNAGTRLVEREGIVAGMTVCTLGQFELAPSIYSEADKVVLDKWKIAKGSADIKELIKDGFLDEDRVHAELHQLVSGTKPGRESDREIILFRTDGLVTQDVAIAYAVYQTAIERGLGVTL